MRILIGAFLCVVGITFCGAASASECEEQDKVVLGTWPDHLGTFTTHVGIKEGFFKTQCIDAEMTYFKESSHFGTTLQRGIEGAVFIFNDLTAFTSNISRHLDTNEGERAYIVGYAADSVYGVYGKKGTQLGVGSKIAVFRCGWKDQDLTSPVPASKKDETLSVLTLNILPWLREHYGDKMGIWCGSEPPAGFEGIHLVPVGSGSKRERAQFDDNGIDFAMHTIERGTKFTVGDDAVLELVVGPERLRKTPEATLFASESCVNNEECREVLSRFNAGLEAARLWLREGGAQRVEQALLEYAAEAEGGSIKNIDTPEIAAKLAPYVLSEVLSKRQLPREAISQVIEDNQWPLEPEDLVAKRLITLQ